MVRRIVLAVILLFGSVARAGGPAQSEMLVLDLGGSGVPADLARSLTDVLVNAVREQVAGRANIVGQADIGAMISLEKQKDLMGCDTSACLAEIGGALGADRIVGGSLGKVGTVFLVTLRLIDTQRNKVERSVSDRVEGRDELLIEAVAQLGRNLVDPTRPYGTGYLRVREPGALVVDGGAPQRTPIDRLAVARGPHELELRDPRGNALWTQRVEVAPYEVTLVTAPLRPTPPPEIASSSPWYAHWWLWTGVAVVGGGTAAYFATRSSGAAPTSSGTRTTSVSVTLHP